MMDTNLVGPPGVYAARCGTGTKTSLRPLGCASAGAVNDSWDPPSDWRDFPKETVTIEGSLATMSRKEFDY